MEAKKAMRIKSTFWRICRERGVENGWIRI